MGAAEIMEAIMIVCFGASWPFSVIRSWKSRSTKGKSLLFLILIDLGYVAGIIGKIFFNPSYVIVFYGINLFLVTADIFLYFRNKRIEMQQ